MYERYEATKLAETEALQVVRDRLEMARLDYAEARRSSPEVAAATQAQADFTAFRKWVWAQGYTFPHPNKLFPLQED